MKGKKSNAEGDEQVQNREAEELKKGPIPRHVAIIMDGNGRWARKQGMPRTEGHRAGIRPIRRTVEAAINLGIEYLTLFAFSTENWGRPQKEVKTLMILLDQALTEELPKLREEGVQLKLIGDISRFPDFLQKRLKKATASTHRNTRFTLSLALNYGGRADIIQAIRKLAVEAARGEISIENITEQLFSERLSTSELPDPDLLIRTSGEIRLSNFLLWEIAYTEFWFTPVLWPDFDSEDLHQAVREYQRRDRRYGQL